MVRKRFSLATLLLSLCASVLADNARDFRAAVKLLRGRKYGEAKAAFLEIAEGSTNDSRKADALLHQARVGEALQRRVSDLQGKAE